MLEKDTHDHVDDTSSETDNLTRLKQLLDEWKMYYLERDEKENGHVFELPLRTENEHHFRLRILLGKDQNICTIRIFFSFYVRKEDRYLMASRMAQINSDIHGTPILQDPGFFLFDPGDVFEIKFQVTLHVRVERGWRNPSFVFIRVTFQFLQDRRIFRDGNGRVVLNRYFVLEMDFPDG